MTNHLEKHELLSTKDLLYQSMARYCDQNKLDVFQYLPIQFVFDFSSKTFSHEIEQFCQYFNCIERFRKKRD